MAKIGKCLVFYFRYPSEMDRLCGTDDRAADGLDSPDRTVDMARQVGEAATRDAVALLNDFAEAMEPLLLSIYPDHVLRKRPSRQLWYSRLVLGNGLPRPNKPIEVGASLRAELQAVVPWIWCNGAKKGEDAAMRILGSRAPGDLQQLSSSPGMVVLARIPLPQIEGNEEVDATGLVDQVVQAVSVLTREDIPRLLNLFGALGENDLQSEKEMP